MLTVFDQILFQTPSFLQFTAYIEDLNDRAVIILFRLIIILNFKCVLNSSVFLNKNLARIRPRSILRDCRRADTGRYVHVLLITN